MIFFADENIEQEIVKHLRKVGYEVYYVSEMSCGIPDENSTKTLIKKELFC